MSMSGPLAPSKAGPQHGCWQEPRATLGRFDFPSLVLSRHQHQRSFSAAFLTNDHKLSSSKHSFLAHSSIVWTGLAGFSAYSLTRPKSRTGLAPMWWLWGSIHLQAISVVGRSQFHTTVGLRSPFPCRLPASGHSQRQQPPPALVRGPVYLQSQQRRVKLL